MGDGAVERNNRHSPRWESACSKWFELLFCQIPDLFFQMIVSG